MISKFYDIVDVQKTHKSQKTHKNDRRRFVQKSHNYRKKDHISNSYLTLIQ